MIDRLSRAGTESQLLALIRELDRAKVLPSLVLLDGEDDLSRALEPADCPVLRLGVRRLFSLGAARAARRLRAFWREHRPDVLQVYFLDAAYFGAPLAKLCGVKKVVRVRNNLGYWLTPRHRALGRLVRPFVDATLTNTEAGKQALVEREGQRDGSRGRAGERRRYRAVQPLHAAGHVEEARPRRLRREPAAGEEHRRPDAGREGGTASASRIWCSRWPATASSARNWNACTPNSVSATASSLRGSVADVPAFLRSVDIAVLPSHSEGMSNALLEYMSAGRAVIATDVGANATLVRDRKDGLIVAAGERNGTRRSTRRVACSIPSAPRAIGASARRRVEADYSRAAMRKRFEEFFRSIIHRPRVSQPIGRPSPITYPRFSNER